jgi:hypothetical protein
MSIEARPVRPRIARRALWPCIAALCLTSIPTARADEPQPATTLVKRLVLPTPAITHFVEVRYSALLTRPMVASGELEYRGPRSLQKRILAPYREQQIIDGDQVTVQREGEKTRRFSLQRTPELQGILDSLGSLLAGDADALARTFIVTMDQGAAGWTLHLAPRSERAQRQLREIMVTGRDDKPDCFVTSEPDGDASFLLLGASSETQLPDPPPRAWTEEFCRVPHD